MMSCESMGIWRVGVLSDTHGQDMPTRQAARAFATRGIRHVFHCGDIGGQEVIQALAGFSVAYVAGNTDWDPAMLEGRIQALGGHFAPLWLDLRLGGKRFAMTHGHDATCLQRLLASGAYDYVLHGHTHVFRDDRMGPTRVVNPGAIHRAFPTTVAVIDLKADTVERIILQEQ